MFAKALFATDLSPASDAVIDCMEGLRRLGTREILLLHAIFVHVHYPETYDTEEAIRKAGKPKLEEQSTRLQEKGFRVTAETAVGRPAKVIAQYAAERGMSLIVVGSHGATMQPDVLLGSVTSELLHKATSPLLIVRHKILEEPGGQVRCEVACSDILADVLYPTDFSDTAERAFSYVEKLAAGGATRIRLLHVQDQAKLAPHLGDRLAEFNEIDSARLSRLRDRLRSLGAVHVYTEVAYGSPTSEIIRKASDGSTSLIVIGSQGRSFLAEVFLGEVAYNVAHLAPVPVLLVPHSR
jgi:nucleotide-binding universal stress UspA family protein